jgi:hypothetical protein
MVIELDVPFDGAWGCLPWDGISMRLVWEVLSELGRRTVIP